MILTIITLLVTIAFFIWGRVRSDIVAMAALMVLTASGVLTTQEALSGFSSPIVLMMIGLFIVGGAILQTGLAQSVGNSIARFSGGNETRAFVLVMLTTAVIGAFVSNTGTVAIMMPIIMSMAATSNIRASRLLMPVAFAGSLGGNVAASRVQAIRIFLVFPYRCNRNSYWNMCVATFESVAHQRS